MQYKVIDLTPRGDSNTAATLSCYILDNNPEMGMDRIRPAMIVCPGGGYEFLSDREAEPVAIQWLAGGFQTFVLRYHISPDRYPSQLLDAAEAVLYVRRHAGELHIDPNRISVSGFSAGGHLAGHIANCWNQPFLSKELGCKQEELRVNGSVLCYPVITGGEKAHRGSFKALLGDKHDVLVDMVSLENCVGEQTPPTFIWHTWPDGCVPVENTLMYLDALKKQGIACEAHIYPEGGHGLSLANEETKSVGDQYNEIVPSCQDWITKAIRFIKAL